MAKQIPFRNQLGWGVEGCGRISNSISLSLSENRNVFHACVSWSLAAFFSRFLRFKNCLAVKKSLIMF